MGCGRTIGAQFARVALCNFARATPCSREGFLSRAEGGRLRAIRAYAVVGGTTRVVAQRFHDLAGGLGLLGRAEGHRQQHAPVRREQHFGLRCFFSATRDRGRSSSGSIRGPSSWPATLPGTAAYGPGDCWAGCTSSATSCFRRATSSGRSMTSTGSISSSVSVSHGSGAERPSAPLARASEAALWTLVVGWGPGAPEPADAAATAPMPQQSSITRPCPPAIAFFPRDAVFQKLEALATAKRTAATLGVERH
eukprot:scaffold124740_cov63-Phaeocystis_antarctica.AAC.2